MEVIYGLLKSKHLDSSNGFEMEGKVGKPVYSSIGKNRLNREFSRRHRMRVAQIRQGNIIIISGLQWYCIERYRTTRR